MRTRLLERVITKLYAAKIAEHGTTVPQYTLLAATVKRPGARAKDLANALFIDASTLSRNLDRLEKLGFIQLQPGNGRDRHIFATEAGRAVLVAAHPDWLAAQNEAAELLGASTEAVYEVTRRLFASKNP